MVAREGAASQGGKTGDPEGTVFDGKMLGRIHCEGCFATGHAAQSFWASGGMKSFAVTFPFVALAISAI